VRYSLTNRYVRIDTATGFPKFNCLFPVSLDSLNVLQNLCCFSLSRSCFVTLNFVPAKPDVIDGSKILRSVSFYGNWFVVTGRLHFNGEFEFGLTDYVHIFLCTSIGRGRYRRPSPSRISGSRDRLSPYPYTGGTPSQRLTR